jgi:hypothetical protein
MTQLRMEGFISEAWDEHLDQTSADECAAADISTEEESSGQLTLKNMGGIFVFHTILSGAALIMAISAWFWQRRPGQVARRAAKKEKVRQVAKEEKKRLTPLMTQGTDKPTSKEALPESHHHSLSLLQQDPSIRFDDSSNEAMWKSNICESRSES